MVLGMILVVISEDCLMLNVWMFGGSGLLVLVWIYGGGFVIGGSVFEMYDVV